MMSCDTNVLFAALDSASMHHAAATAFLRRVTDTENSPVTSVRSRSNLELRNAGNNARFMSS
jgi:hypothetical protein